MKASLKFTFAALIAITGVALALLPHSAWGGGRRPAASATAEANALLNAATPKCRRFAEFTKATFESDGKGLRVWLNFNNAEFKRFWTREVAVQYMFDAALHDITAAILDSKNARFQPVEKVILVVNIRPHACPPVLEWEISRTAFNMRKTQLSNEALFKVIKITAGGKKFEFDPVLAASIE